MQVTTNSMVLFWQTDTIYSNWYQPCRFYYDERLFDNSEAAFMYAKAVIFNDIDVALKIQNGSQDPKLMKSLGRKIKNFDQTTWDNIKFETMFNVCYEKFSQIESFKKDLLATGDRIMVEASPFDKIWGIGLAPNDPLALDPKNWKGENLLGKVLMDVREKLKNG